MATVSSTGRAGCAAPPQPRSEPDRATRTWAPGSRCTRRPARSREVRALAFWQQLEDRLLGWRERLVAARAGARGVVLLLHRRVHRAGLGWLCNVASADGDVLAGQVQHAATVGDQVLRPVAGQAQA